MFVTTQELGNMNEPTESVQSNLYVSPRDSLKIIHYETDIKTVDFGNPTVFLAGPTVRGNQPHLKSWRPEACELFDKFGFNGNIICPDFTNKYESDKYRYDLPVWEFAGLTNSTVILFWIPRTKELIGLTTNCEFGYWMARDRSKMIYGRPDESYRNRYLDIMWVEDGKRYPNMKKVMPFKDYCDCTIHNTLEKTVKASMERCI